MNADSSLEASTWEKFTDGLTAMSEGVVGFLGRLFGSSNDRMVRSLGYVRGREGTQVPGARHGVIQNGQRSVSISSPSGTHPCASAT